MTRLALPILLAVAVITPAATAGAPVTRADAEASIRMHYGSLIRESSLAYPRVVTYKCVRFYPTSREFKCVTTLRYSPGLRKSIVSDWSVICSTNGRFCEVRRLITRRYP